MRRLITFTKSPPPYRIDKKDGKATVLILCSALFIISVFSAAYTATAASAAETIKVLILDEQQKTAPDLSEKLTSLGRLEGMLHANGSQYSGNLEVWEGTKGLYIINELPIEEYIENVVAAEIGTGWDIEAIKVQAVISRTYALYKKMASENSRFNITSSVLHQAYKGKNTQIQIAYAVRETKGEVLLYNGKPIEALYHSTCGGKTEDSSEVFGNSYPYLKPVASLCPLSPYWTWEKTIPLAEIEKAVNIKGIKEMTINSFTSTNRVRDIQIEAETGKSIIKATELRKLLGWKRLPSTSFHINKSGDSVLFEGKGYGHGVGLCQWSALQMAKEGKRYKEILSFFYPGTEIKTYAGE